MGKCNFERKENAAKLLNFGGKAKQQHEVCTLFNIYLSFSLIISVLRK